MTKKSALANKYLTFGLADEEYGLEVLHVDEVFGMMDITPVPHTPEHIKGVINHRENIIPVLCLRQKISMPEKEHDDATCIILVNIAGVDVGVIVDHVLEVLNIPAKEIDAPPSFGTNVETDFIMGMGKWKKRVITLLDITKLFGNEELPSA